MNGLRRYSFRRANTYSLCVFLRVALRFSLLVSARVCLRASNVSDADVRNSCTNAIVSLDGFAPNCSAIAPEMFRTHEALADDHRSDQAPALIAEHCSSSV